MSHLRKIITVALVTHAAFHQLLEKKKKNRCGIYQKCLPENESSKKRTWDGYSQLLMDVPERIKCGATSQFSDALGAAISTFKAGNIKSFKMKLLTRKSNAVQSDLAW